MATRERVRDFLDFGLVKSHHRNLNLAVRFNQKNGWNHAKAIGVRNRIACAVDKNREGHANLAREIARSAGVILGNADERDICAAITFKKPFEKWESEFANRTGNLEERKHNRTALQRGTQGKFFAFGRFQRETRCCVPRNDVRHAVFSSKPAQKPAIDRHGKKSNLVAFAFTNWMRAALRS